MNLRVGIDVGGTFTDVTVFDEDTSEIVAVRKYLSNPIEPAAVMEAITQELARDFSSDCVSLILHGSTVALNTLLEGKGARVGLLTTRGFRDVYEIGRQWRMLADEAIVNLRMDRFKFSSPGIFGAKPARASKAVLNPGTAAERALTSKIAGLRLERGDLLSLEFAGGGGWGNPHGRDPQRVRDDVARDYVSAAGAREDYGVVLTPDLQVDAHATEELRRQGSPPPAGVASRGGCGDELGVGARNKA